MRLFSARLLVFFISLSLVWEQPAFAQVPALLDISGSLAVTDHLSDKFRPLHLRALSFKGASDFKAQLDKGDLKDPGLDVLERTVKILRDYFFIGLALPDNVFWVNLRPDAENDVIDPDLAKTDIGRIMLAADVQLKKDVSRLTSPDTPQGKKYWDRLCRKAEELYGSSHAAIPALTRPWIVPGEIILGETPENVYIYKSTLKVMLEQDYLKGSAAYKFDDPRAKELNEYSSLLIRELILPLMNREINTSRRYSALRQVFYSLVLAQWFKSRHRGETGAYAASIDGKDLSGLTSKEPWQVSGYFREYRKSFRDGEYDISRAAGTGETVREYFSGGMNLQMFMPAPAPLVNESTRGGTKITVIAGKEHNLLPGNLLVAMGRDNWTGAQPEIKTAIPELRTAAELRDGGAQETPAGRRENRYIAELGQSLKKSKEQIRKELDETVRTEHIKLSKTYGFIGHGESAATDKVYEIFNRLAEAFNRVAAEQNQPAYKGRLYLVDSPVVNAFVFAEHEDVYVHMGLLRELARFCAKSGSPVFSEDLIAALIGHELTHVLQNSSFEGLNFSDLQSRSARYHELLDIKRNKEFHADEGSANLLYKAGYSPDAILDVLSFLRQITRTSSAQETLSDHPHPKVRLTNVEMYFENPDLVITGFNKRQRLDPGAFMNAPSAHAGPRAQNIRSNADFVAQIRSARTIQEVFELAILAANRSVFSGTRALAESPEGKAAFARLVFMYNTLEMLGKIRDSIRHQYSADMKRSEFFPQSEQLGAYILETVDADTGGMSVSPERFSLSRAEADITNGFRRKADEIVKTILNSDAPADKKLSLLKLVRRVRTFFEHEVKNVGLDNYGSYAASPAGGERELDAIVGPVLSGDLSGLKQLLAYPFSLYTEYGRKALDYSTGLRELNQNASWMKNIASAHLEIEDSALYTPDVRLLPLETEAQRRKVMEIAALNWLYKEAADHYGDEPLAGALADEIYDAVIRVAPDAQGMDPAEAREMLALLISAKADKDNPAVIAFKTRPGNNADPRFLRYLRSLLPIIQRQIHSSVFLNEYGRDIENTASLPTINYFYNREGLSEPEDFELNHDVFGAIQYVLQISGDRPSIEMMGGLLSRFSKPFRARMISEDAFWSRFSSFWSLQDFETLFSLLVDYSDSWPVLLKIANIKVKQGQNYRERSLSQGSLAALKDVLAVFDRIMSRRAPTDKILPEDFGRIYVEASVALMRAQEGSIDVSAVFTRIAGLSCHVLLVYKTFSRYSYGPYATDWMRGNIDSREYSKEQLHLKELSPEQIPVGFFEAPEYAEAQLFFRQMFGLSRQQIQEILRNQRELIERSSDGSESIGRVALYSRSTDMTELLNKMLILRLLEEFDSSARPFNPTDFSKVIKGSLSLSTYQGEHFSLYVSLPSYTDLARMFVDRFDAALREDPHAADSFFRELARGFIKSDKTDEFFENLVLPHNYGEPHEYRLQTLFPLFHILMVNAQIPQSKFLNSQEMPHFDEQVSYLTAIASDVDIQGPKARLFKQFEAKFLRLAKSKLSVQEKVRLLLSYLPKASLFRDGYIDMWEVQLLPEIYPGSVSDAIFGAMLAGTNSAEETALKLFRQIVATLPSQWEKLASMDFALPPERAQKLLDFYKEAIPLIADPQKQARYGATALKIMRAAHPSMGFAEEFDLIVNRFFPAPSKIRDAALDDLVNRHLVPSEEVGLSRLQEVMQKYSAQQRGVFDEEFLFADAVQQMVKGMLAGASREERMKTLLWLMSPGSYPQPELFTTVTRKTNITFTALPDDTRSVPEELKNQLIVDILMGENGLMDPRNEEETQVMRETIEAIFTRYFPASSKELGFTMQEYEIFKDIFLSVMETFNSSRRTKFILTCLGFEKGLGKLSTGDKLARLLSAVGPVGVKIGQILSEGNLVGDKKLRSSLGTLRDEASPLSKWAVLNTLKEAGYDLNTLRVGEMLGSASMKQVNAGELRQADGSWRPVVIKILRPLIKRQIDEDMKVLREVLHRMTAKHPEMDVGDLEKEVEKIIREEEDFAREMDNAVAIGKAVREYRDAHPGGAYSLITPAVMNSGNGGDISVIIEEKIEGAEFSKIFPSDGNKNLAPAGRRLLSRRGFSKEQVRTIERMVRDRGSVFRMLRKVFLHQVFDRGVFHADLHQGNVMATKDGRICLIDLGLIGNFNAEQQEAAKTLIKGVLLRDAGRTAAGINALLTASGGGRAEERMLSQIRETLLRNQDMYETLKEILRITLERTRGNPGRENVVRFMKAFTQALWLFPLDFDSFNDMKRSLGLSDAEYWKALAAQAIPTVKTWIKDGLEGIRGKVGSLFAFLNKAAENMREGKRKVSQAIEMKKNLEKAQAIFESPAQRPAQTLLLEKKVKTILSTTISFSSIDNSYKTLDEKISMTRENPEIMRFKENLTPDQREYLDKALEAYWRILGMTNSIFNGYTPASQKELELARLMIEDEFGKKLEVELMSARVITARYMRQHSGDSPLLGIFGIQNPMLREIMEKMADVILEHESMVKGHLNRFFEEQQRFGDDVPSYRSFLTLYLDGRGGREAATFREEYLSLPAFAESSAVRDFIKKNASLQPDRMISMYDADAQIAMTMERSGYGEKDTFSVTAVSLKENIVCEMLLGQGLELKSFNAYRVNERDGGNEDRDVKGGIDFRTLPVAVRSALPLVKSLTTSDASRLAGLDIDRESSKIAKLIRSGNMPSGERIKEYVLACLLKRRFEQERVKILVCIASILRMEEDKAMETDAQVRDLLVLAESL